MFQSYRDQAEGISLELMSIGTADSTALYFYEDIVVAASGIGYSLISKCSRAVRTAT